MSYKFNVRNAGAGFFDYYLGTAELDPIYFKLDQTTPQTIVGGTEINNKTLNQIITDTKLFAIAMATAL